MSPTLSNANAPALTEATPIYYGILTDQGQALLADAIASGTPLPLTQMAVGDGAGQPVTPLPEMTELTNEVYRASLNQLFVDPTAPNQIVAEMVMGETIGGFWIRELGLYDESGTLFAVANAPASYKPVLDEGAGRALLTRMVLIVSDTSAVELILNPDTVMASKAYVDAKIAEHAASRDHPAAIEGAQGMIPLATQAMVDEGADHASAVTPKTAGESFARQQHEHEIDDVLWLQEALDEKADIGHQHETGDVAGLPEALAEKLNRGGDTATGNLTAPKFIMNAAQGTGDGDAVRYDYLLGSIPKRAVLVSGHLDNYTTQGFYHQSSTSPDSGGNLGYPVNKPGALLVLSNGGGLTQIYIVNPSSTGAQNRAIYYRNYWTGTWSATWTKLYDTSNPPTAADVGAMPKSGGAFDAGAKVSFSGGFNGPDDVALDMGNQAIGRVHNIVFSDSSGDASEAILWPKTGTGLADPDLANYDSFRVIDGIVYINTSKIFHQEFKQPHTIGTPTELGANVDLDTLKTPGVYSQGANAEATTALHYPEASAGSLVVYQAAGIIQEYRVYNSAKIWVRAQYSTGAWTDWAKQYNTANKPTAVDVGAAPVSHTHPPADVGAAPISHTHTAAQGNQDIVAGGYGQVGTYVLAWNADGQSVFIGNTKPGSNLIPATAGERREDGHFLSGTYKCMGHVFGSGNSDDATTLWIRTDAASLFDQQLTLSELGWDNAEHDSATAIVTFAGSGVSLPFTAFKDDVEAHGRWLFAMIRDGEFGPVAEYIPPTQQEIAASENPALRQKEMARATAKVLHWDMMGDATQAIAWRSYYRALYTLEQTPDWPQVAQWPLPPVGGVNS